MTTSFAMPSVHHLHCLGAGVSTSRGELVHLSLWHLSGGGCQQVMDLSDRFFLRAWRPPLRGASPPGKPAQNKHKKGKRPPSGWPLGAFGRQLAGPQLGQHALPPRRGMATAPLSQQAQTGGTPRTALGTPPQPPGRPEAVRGVHSRLRGPGARLPEPLGSNPLGLADATHRTKQPFAHKANLVQGAPQRLAE